MAISYPDGAGITAVDATDLEANDMYFPGLAVTGSDNYITQYSNIKAAIMSNPGGIGSTHGATYLLLANSQYHPSSGPGLFLTPRYSKLTLTGASVSFTAIGGSAGHMIIACQLYVSDTVVDDGGDDTWDAAWTGGVSQTIVTGAAAAIATDINVIFNPFANSPICTSPAYVTVTPNGGVFVSGEIECVTYTMRLFGV